MAKTKTGTGKEAPAEKSSAKKTKSAETKVIAEKSAKKSSSSTKIAEKP